MRAENAIWIRREPRSANLAFECAKVVLLPLPVLIASTSVLFLTTLAAMLLRHPDVEFYAIDRVTFGLLLASVAARVVLYRQKLSIVTRVSIPMLALSVLALASVLGQPFDHETWSLLASKFLVPFTLFHVAQLVFTQEKEFRYFETFAVIVLAYLSFTSIAFLCGAQWLIFPRFILDESLGHHADRARGPLLQAVANGVSLNLLALLVLHAYRRNVSRRLRTFTILASVPVAIIATMTRAVWFSFAGSIAALIFLSHNKMRRRACVALIVVTILGVGVVTSSTDCGAALNSRLSERGPLDYREAVYAGSWQMFLVHPLMGWGFHAMPAALPRFVSGYEEKLLYPHNTYLEILVEQGLLGLAFYLWLMWELFRLRLGTIPQAEEHSFLDQNFHRLWPILLGVYWANAVAVVMSYQFVNGLMFTIAGMLAAQRNRATGPELC